MTIQRVEKAEWQPFLDSLSKLLSGKPADIEVASLRIGAQIEAERLPLLGLTYDPKSDVIEVALEGVDHLIRKPRELYFDAEAGELGSVEIVDADGTRQIVKLSDPLMLPRPPH